MLLDFLCEVHLNSNQRVEIILEHIQNFVSGFIALCWAVLITLLMILFINLLC